MVSVGALYGNAGNIVVVNGVATSASTYGGAEMTQSCLVLIPTPSLMKVDWVLTP